MNKITIWISITYAFILALFMAAWFSDSTVYRPLIADLTQTNSIVIVEALERENITYKANPDNNMLFVSGSDYTKSLTVLNNLSISQTGDPISSNLSELIAQPIMFYQQSWFIHIYKLMFCTLIAIVIFLALVRPMLRIDLINEK
jgi:flagellar biosynthesis/type III secretory pathway M-ring protein FliF/YscJ